MKEQWKRDIVRERSERWTGGKGHGGKESKTGIGDWIRGPKGRERKRDILYTCSGKHFNSSGHLSVGLSFKL